MKTRIAVLVSGGGTNLQALLDAEAQGRIPHGEIALVVSNNPKAYALERAKQAGVPPPCWIKPAAKRTLKTGSSGFWSWTALT